MAREMKDSGVDMVGKIPYNWEMKPIKAIASYNDETLNEATDKSFEFDYIDIGSVQYGKGITQYQRMKFRDAPSRARRIVRRNDIIVSTVRTYLKAVAKIDNNDFPQVASTGFVVVRAKEALPQFLYYALLSEAFICAVESHSTGISYPAINASDVVKLKIPIPPVDEQRRISAFLDLKCVEIDAVLDKTRASIEEYKKLKQAIITQAVTKGIRGDRLMKESGIEWIGEVPSDYSVYRLKHLVKGRLEYGANASGVEFSSILPRYIRITDITPDGKLKKTGKLSLEEDTAKPYTLHDGDILFARSGATVGKSFIYKEAYGRAAFAGYLIKATIMRDFSADYVYLYTNSSLYNSWKDGIFIQSTIQNIGADRYAELPVVIPDSYDEQIEIVSYLNNISLEIDRIILRKEQTLVGIETYKKSLIYEYVTGKKEVI